MRRWLPFVVIVVGLMAPAAIVGAWWVAVAWLVIAGLAVATRLERRLGPRS